MLHPYLNARYLFCLQIGIPALIYPFGVGQATSSDRWVGALQVMFAQVALIALTLVFVLATCLAFADIPAHWQ